MPHRGISNEYPQHMFLWRTGEKYPIIITKYSSLTIPLYITTAPDKRSSLINIFSYFFLKSNVVDTSEYCNRFSFRNEKNINTLWIKNNNKKTNNKPYLELSLRKHAYSNILKMLPPKNKKYSGEAVLTRTHNLCFWAEIRKKNVYSSEPQ